MRLFRAAPLQLQRQSHARRAFTPVTPRASTFSTAAATMASSSQRMESEQASVSVDPAAKDNVQPASQSETPLGLPEPPSGDEATKLDMSSGQDSVRFDHLGPIVVNKDGTLSRIGNWEQMSEMERKNTMRILGKRNKQRMDAMKAAEGGTADEK